MTILIFGAKGQVGRALTARLGDNALLLDREEVDLADKNDVIAALDRIQPRVVINAAAYTAVDQAERESVIAYLINADAPAAMARWCASRSIPFVHYSTDYVYDGNGNSPRSESEPIHPLNHYGHSKAKGDEAVAKAGGNYLIFRTSWVYDASGANFVNTILRLAAEREELRIIADQFGAPTYAPDLADATLKALQVAQHASVFPSGIYHACNSGETTWHEFAEAIIAEARVHGASLAVQRIVPISTQEYPLPAPRPRNSRLDCAKLRTAFDITLPDWREALAACMNTKYGH